MSHSGHLGCKTGAIVLLIYGKLTWLPDVMFPESLEIYLAYPSGIQPIESVWKEIQILEINLSHSSRPITFVTASLTDSY